MELKHFQLSEFDSPDKPGSGANMKPEFLQRIDNARALAGIPFKINSGFRTKAHNAQVKGVKDSSHCYGYAADIHCIDLRKRLIMVKALLSAGFTRIGISDGFIHCDCDPTKDKECIWLY
jgi:zinc D-Ala-D-Ala carboxypeptidase